MGVDGIGRRELIQRAGGLGGLLALSPVLAGVAEAGAPAARTGPAPGAVTAPGGLDVYESIGVRPLINGRGTFTILSGSLMLPEVLEAIDAAARQYVHLDELADAVGRRLGELTGAEFGMVSSGCSAGLGHAAAACTAGGNPDLHIQIPDLTGFEKTEAIIPRHSRNVYEAAVSAIGLTVVEVETRAELESALGPQTALVYIMAGPRVDESELDTATIAEIARPHGVPVLVDAAAEILTIPNVHLERGADLVAYSGGKCLRGPQTAGLLLGREDLVRAAWVHSAPHHGYGRGFKVGKEEAIGMLAAVEMWLRRDHDAEWDQWTGWLEHIASTVSTVDGVTTRIVQPEGLSNRTPSLRVYWDEEQVGLSGATASATMYDGEPRIALNSTSGDAPGRTGVSITPYMMSPGDDKIIARELRALLLDPPEPPEPPRPPAVDVAGTWQVSIEYTASSSDAHVLELTQDGADLSGTHTGEFVSREATGTVSGETVSIRSSYGESHGDALSFTFTGTVSGDGTSMSGALDMGEYLRATWTATRQA
ncbi:aminotransferase class V-fold PLP-dependent enzyme [Jiangella asiatica]|uniref:Aminotransferase class V-fold PLP-dependent enzyme n=1 Tax=Jiangella asiatica TaxID=2530372 RepID=A0A4R5D864_9ACTN|nr:aminotransferase class V-fold PLP-dependent enzyme [Jiangella asiatica]TDE07921.1 aminotransferase class V-fold PLP-dependent enzyme [Jiangella asiatica]